MGPVPYVGQHTPDVEDAVVAVDAGAGSNHGDVAAPGSGPGWRSD